MTLELFNEIIKSVKELDMELDTTIHEGTISPFVAFANDQYLFYFDLEEKTWNFCEDQYFDFLTVDEAIPCFTEWEPAPLNKDFEKLINKYFKGFERETEVSIGKPFERYQQVDIEEELE